MTPMTSKRSNFKVIHRCPLKLCELVSFKSLKEFEPKLTEIPSYQGRSQEFTKGGQTRGSGDGRPQRGPEAEYGNLREH